MLGTSTVGNTSDVTNLDKITDFSFAQSDKIVLQTGTVANIVATPARLLRLHRSRMPVLLLRRTSRLRWPLLLQDTNFVATGSQGIAANQAVLFNWNDGAATRSFILVNGGNTQYDTTDFVVEVTGIALKSGDCSTWWSERSRLLRVIALSRNRGDDCSSPLLTGIWSDLDTSERRRERRTSPFFNLTGAQLSISPAHDCLTSDISWPASRRCTSVWMMLNACRNLLTNNNRSA